MCDVVHKDILCFGLRLALAVCKIFVSGFKPAKDRGKQMFVLDSKIVTQVTELREALERVAMREDINKNSSNWLFSLCESLGELEN